MYFCFMLVKDFTEKTIFFDLPFRDLTARLVIETFQIFWS